MNRKIYQFCVALASGAVFGFGLSLSGMLNPARVQGFLDIFGAWDPSLAFVLGGAVIVAFIGVQITKRMHHPTFDNSFHVPTSRRIDRPLIIGSALFGLGWGIGGFCPGPAIASLSVGLPQTVLFVIAMLVGMIVHDRIWSRRS
ncbi:YeeE/YedE family protein [Brucella grignonensis]|uniref:Sulfur transport family protein n=1 Tax=Brucella grignonensis TaxID=94627 RepID=A0A256F1C0_9HYPH|nr:YeeE/YedE family protein [Brucella grignonensis]NKB84459.1 YeeE/YedE family protein [Brucella grignonensis]NKB84733.1 YeeE/YedE family protein [Brucella grignonensis]OYR08496.1 sulfur transport family protein [Brucella grignonensis]